ncbi:hypothetical protein KAJ27_15635 [bacterium]|nr:hypothetical protein [bacterium]
MKKILLFVCVCILISQFSFGYKPLRNVSFKYGRYKKVVVYNVRSILLTHLPRTSHSVAVKYNGRLLVDKKIHWGQNIRLGIRARGVYEFIPHIGTMKGHPFIVIVR